QSAAEAAVANIGPIAGARQSGLPLRDFAMTSIHADVANKCLIEALELRLLPHRGMSRPQFLNLRNSARAGMLRIFRDQLARPIGYVAWAMIDRASLDRLLRFGRLPAYQYEWNEGGICLII